MTPANIQDEDMQWLTTLSGTQANIKGKALCKHIKGLLKDVLQSSSS